MLDFNTLTEFSSTYCIGICAFLIPANLVATASTIIFTLLGRPTITIWQTAGIASVFALLMILHVFAWFTVGVVMAPTYILLALGSICLLANLGVVLSNKRLINTYN
ncbi:hypothetical protein G7B40_034905 [Aetokthonos hydrillicola Thurmond2011]|jgi:4-amino-4-deoxy-L-arabinose transferase-like glycosyltransferase|uniref:Uncharacterized protein n=1 Tax=Aetokthonos hydrillicola Thurmond2011 TaxID=2712845 RepID=A0AAP5IDN9_9CYAN|nr:hypothetical protein [Aetokthonos hydrillicola]MBO3463989.1 hypothetical protein [Aetokthonos hydrillicola CCALA 1050]MBW4591194.1 hypothetical protein [Aetokthonos hydrillicola CCALA 1050]MDR9899711.1 hypothetical protein [Aetokthonos hydrillicola Thurmond2011]